MKKFLILNVIVKFDCYKMSFTFKQLNFNKYCLTWNFQAAKKNDFEKVKLKFGVRLSIHNVIPLRNSK
jgi:hypothetical protein